VAHNTIGADGWPGHVEGQSGKKKGGQPRIFCLCDTIYLTFGLVLYRPQ
jgi:hypothetical protein